MLKALLVATLLGVIIGTCGGCAGAWSRKFTTKVEQWDRAVHIRAIVGDKLHEGSGVIVNEKWVLTAFHVVKSIDARITITMFNGREISGYIDAVAEKADIARVRLSESPGPVRPLRVARAFVGDMICFQPRVPDDRRSCGEVTKVSSGKDGITHDALSIGGNSGSGMYDSRGRIVGIVTTRIGDEGGQATPLSPRRWLVEGGRP